MKAPLLSLAVVDARPILLSEVRLRTRPIVSQKKAAGENVTDANVAELERLMIQRVIDERIIEQD
jgi:hypothetical protein